MSRASLAWLAALVAITLGVYHPAWHGGVLWDDDGHLTSRALEDAGGLWRIWFDVGATQQYYPVVHTAFWIMNALWGANMLGYHLVTIVLHAIDAWLVALILQRLNIRGAWIAALIFALHPVHVESVAWITELKNTLSGFFYLLAALAYLKWAGRARPLPRADRFGVSYFTALGLFALALLSKSVTATLPAGLLIVIWWQNGRISWVRDVRPLIPFVLLGGLAGFVTAWVERTVIGATGALFELSLVERTLLAGRIVWFYLGKLFWPVNLTFIYPRWTVSAGSPSHYVPLMTTLAVTFLLWSRRGRSRAPLAAWLLFIATLGPALGFVNVFPFKYSFVADHFQYLASIVVIALVASAIARVLSRRELVAATVIATTLGALTWQQSHEYVSATELYTRTLEKNPNCWMAHNNLAAIALVQSPPALDRALSHVQSSLAINVDNDVAHNNLGLVRQRQGDFAAAIREHEEAVRLNPHYADAHVNLGVDLAALGRVEEATLRYRTAIALRPDVAGSHYNLGLLLARTGRPDDALAELREAIRLNPAFADAHDALGSALHALGRTDEAIAEYQKAVRRNPANAAFHNNLGAALFAGGRLDEAAAALGDAARLQPDAGLTQDNLGRVLLMLGRHDEAAIAFQTAVRLAPDYGPAHEHHAKMLQDAGQLADAIAEYDRALRLTPASAEAHNNIGVALAMSGRLSDAASHFAEAVRLRPDFAEARANLAKARGGG